MESLACLVSVIIPAYNSEKYIERCIGGVLNCQETELEVIVVDDGSTDNTYSVVKLLAEKDSRVKVYTQQNQGVSKTRNVGLSYAQGKYVIFSDSDDMLEGKNLKQLIDFAEDCNADLVAFGRVNCYENGSRTEYFPKGNILNVADDFQFAFSQTILNQPNFGWSSCNKLFKREIINNNNIRFLDYRAINSEDRLFNLCYFMNISKVAFFEKCHFYNFVRDDSLSHAKGFPESVKRNIKAFEYVCDYTICLPEDVRYKLLRYYFVSFLNNVVVLELDVNDAGVKSSAISFRDAIIGMNEVLEAKGIICKFNYEKSIYYADNGFKYRMLNNLILKHNFYPLAATILFGYVKFTDMMNTFKSKQKGKK